MDASAPQRPQVVPVVRRDAALVRLGYCGAIDDSRRLRCYRCAGHAGPCVFAGSFQLRRP
jgi:hypothetical protein